MIRAILMALALVLAFAAPAEAHKLKVFAAVEGDHVGGYGFFIGGGRAQGTEWLAKAADGTVLAEGRTHDDGTFGFDLAAPPASNITIILNTEEGHIARTVLAASRFTEGVGETAVTEPSGTVAAAAAPAAGAAPAASSSETADLVAAAVQRQVEPLLERIEEMDSRMRFSDIVSGIFLIIGLAGIGLWAKASNGNDPDRGHPSAAGGGAGSDRGAVAASNPCRRGNRGGRRRATGICRRS